MIILYIMMFILVLIVLYNFLTRKYVNPYKLIMIFGKKGSGKTTNLTKLAIKHYKKGWTVYCTEHIPFTYYVPHELIGQVEFKENSLLLIDEVGMIYDNRDFKNFQNYVRDWFKLQRHRKVKVIMFSQTFDIDIKLRNLTDELYLVNNVFRVFSYAKKIDRNIIITKANAESPSTIADELNFVSVIWFWCGSRMITYIPKYTKYFDTYSADKLRDYNFKYNDYKKSNKKRSKKNEICSIRKTKSRLHKLKNWTKGARRKSAL